jgi:hypothetical protein
MRTSFAQKVKTFARFATESSPGARASDLAPTRSIGERVDQRGRGWRICVLCAVAISRPPKVTVVSTNDSVFPKRRTCAKAWSIAPSTICSALIGRR